MVAVLVSTLTLFLTPVILSSFDFARVAQWIERLPPEQEAAGSNPAAGMIGFGPLQGGPFLIEAENLCWCREGLSSQSHERFLRVPGSVASYLLHPGCFNENRYVEC
jgi:hypothetical protein